MIATAVTQPPVPIFVLLVLGALLCVFGNIATVFKAFGKSFVFGVIGAVAFCVPFGTLVFSIVNWRDFNRIFYAQLAAIIVLCYPLGYLFFQNQGAVKDAAAPPALEQEGAHAHGTGENASEPISPTSGASAHRDVPVDVRLASESTDVFLSEKELALKEMYEKVSRWYADIKLKRPGPNAQAAEIMAFNEESRRYEELLDQYKRQFNEFQAEKNNPKK
jgi:predicted signal transduction protein with EAL and GGDEF domain